MKSCRRSSVLVVLVLASIPLVAQQLGAPGQSANSAMAAPSAAADPNNPGEQSPALVVRWEQGKLTLNAHRASLHSVLQAISQRTGMVLDVASGSDAGLVYMDLGPGSMREVLSALLEGDQNNYIMLGSRTNPGSVDRLILSRSDQKAVVVANTAAAAQGNEQPQLYGSGYSAESQAQMATVETQEEPPPPVHTAPPSIQKSVDPAMERYQQAYAEAVKNGKSPSQALQELQQQQIKELDSQMDAQAAAQQQH